MAVSCNLYTIGSNCIVNELEKEKKINSILRFQRNKFYLVIFRSQLVQTLLDHVVAIEVLNEHDDVQAQGNDNRVYLSIVSKISLLPSMRKQYGEDFGIGIWTCLTLRR